MLPDLDAARARRSARVLGRVRQAALLLLAAGTLAALLPLEARADGARGRVRRLERRYQPDLRRVVGQGNEKIVYAAKNRPDHVVVVSRSTDPQRGREQLLAERARLEKLSPHVPTAELGPHGWLPDGRYASVMKRYAAGSKRAAPGEPKLDDFFNARSVRDHQRILDGLHAARLGVIDLQVLIANDGGLVVADPKGVFEQPHQKEMNFVIGVTDRLAELTTSIDTGRGSHASDSATEHRPRESRPNDGKQTRHDLPARARTTTNVDTVFARLERFNGIDRHLASERLHELKAAFGRGGADNVLFDLSGNVYDPQTKEWLGSLTAGGAKRTE